MDRKWHWMTEVGEISYENHWQQASVVQDACTPGLPVMLRIPSFPVT